MRGQSLSEYAMTIAAVAAALIAMRIFVTQAARKYVDNSILGRLASEEDVAPNSYGRDKTYEVAGAPTTTQGQSGFSYHVFGIEPGGVATRDFRDNNTTTFQRDTALGD